MAGDQLGDDLSASVVSVLLDGGPLPWVFITVSEDGAGRDQVFAAIPHVPVLVPWEDLLTEDLLTEVFPVIQIDEGSQNVFLVRGLEVAEMAAGLIVPLSGCVFGSAVGLFVLVDGQRIVIDIQFHLCQLS